VVYPVSPRQASNNQHGPGGAFDAGTRLFNAGIDFTFIDYQSLARVEVRDSRLHVAGMQLPVLVLADLPAVRHTTLTQALALFRAGGVVLALGQLPEASDRTGSGDPEVDAIVTELFGLTAQELRAGGTGAEQRNAAGGLGLHLDHPDKLTATLRTELVRNFISPSGQGKALHRRVGPRDVYMVMDAPQHEACFFRAHGKVEWWDAWSGTTRELSVVEQNEDGTVVRIPVAPPRSSLIVFSPGEPLQESETATDAASGERGTLNLDGPWASELVPTMDNRWGDFRLPASDELIGAEARELFYHRDTAPASAWHGVPDEGHGDWPRVRTSFGPQMYTVRADGHRDFEEFIQAAETAGQQPGGFTIIRAVYGDLDDPERCVDVTAALINRITDGVLSVQAGNALAGDPAPQTAKQLRVEYAMNGEERVAIVPESGQLNIPDLPWRPYEFSWRWGVLDQPGSQGYHGLKGNVSDGFLILDGGGHHLFRTALTLDEDTEAVVRIEGVAPERIVVAGVPLEGDRIRLTRGTHPVLIAYRNAPGGHREGGPHPIDSRARSAVVFVRADADPVGEAEPLSMKWHSQAGLLPYDAYAGQRSLGYYRFLAPPGLQGLRFAAHGRVGVRVAGREVDLQALGSRRRDGATDYRVALDAAQPDPVWVDIGIRHRPGYYGGAALPDAVRLETGAGRIAAGDWAHMGVLRHYSGGIRYGRNFTLSAGQAAGRVEIDLGQVIASCELTVNGRPAGVLINVPFVADISNYIQPGDNRIEVLVYNTLSNHYQTTPSPYKGNPASGLIGPARLVLTPAPAAP
jgi:hypothetical protein